MLRKVKREKAVPHRHPPPINQNHSDRSVLRRLRELQGLKLQGLDEIQTHVVPNLLVLIKYDGVLKTFPTPQVANFSNHWQCSIEGPTLGISELPVDSSRSGWSVCQSPSEDGGHCR